MASVSYSVSHNGLIQIQNFINGRTVDNARKPEGMFFRVQDFSNSYAELITQYMDELKIADEVFPLAESTDELHGLISARTRPYSTSRNNFQTALLSPALRHYLNDACRLLEPYTELFLDKFVDFKFTHRNSLSASIKELREKNMLHDLDSEYIIEIYDVWNDYKHRSTTGLHAGSWKYEDSVVIKPTLILPKSTQKYEKLSRLNVYEFVEETNKAILDFLKFIYG